MTSSCAELAPAPVELARYFSRVISIAWRRDGSDSLRHGVTVGARRTFCGVTVPSSGAALMPGRIPLGPRASSSVECKRCRAELPTQTDVHGEPFEAAS